MSKLELPAGQDNVIVRNQEVYGFLPKDVINRLGDTSTQLATEDQTALGAINELKSNLTEYTTLYYDANGTNGTVVLSDNVSNYDYIKIFYNYSTYGSSCVEVSDYSKGVSFSLPYLSSWQGTNYLQILYKRCDVSGTSITVVKTGYVNIFHGRNPEIDPNANNITIYKVIGVKLPS